MSHELCSAGGLAAVKRVDHYPADGSVVSQISDASNVAYKNLFFLSSSLEVRESEMAKSSAHRRAYIWNAEPYRR